MNDTISEDDEDEEKEKMKEKSSASKKIKLSHDKISKFDSLKQKRLDLQLKHERKQLKAALKSKPKQVNDDDDYVKNESKKEKKKDQQAIFSQDDSQRVSLRKLETDLDKAIELNDVDLADRLSDKLASKQNELDLEKQTTVTLLLNSQLTKPNEANKINKSLKWTFESKKRWETKSNM